MQALFITYVISIMPLIELRGGIPFGHFKLGLPMWEAFIAGVLGSITAVVMFLYILPYIVDWAEKNSKWIHDRIQKLFHKTRKTHSKQVNKLGHIALVTFVALPIPGSGAWVGSVVAYIFGVPYRKAVGLISLGLLIGGVIVVAVSQGAYGIITRVTNDITETVAETVTETVIAP